MVTSFNSPAVVSTTWLTYKSVAITGKSLLVQYDNNTNDGLYTIFSLDGNITYTCTIWTGTVPPYITPVYSQAQNDSDKTDFQNNYQAAANQIIAPASQPNTGLIPPITTITGGTNRAANATTTRTSRGGDTRIGQESIFFWDVNDGGSANINPMVWNNAVSSMTITGGTLLLNANSTLTSGSYAILTGVSTMPLLKDVAVVGSFRANFVQQTNGVIECGFGVPITNSATINNSVFFRINSAGATFLVYKYSGLTSEQTTALNITLNSTSYYTVVLTIENMRINIQIEDNSGTVIVNKWITATVSNSAVINIAHLTPFYRVYNNAATSAAAQIFVAETLLYSKDLAAAREWPLQMASIGRNAYWNPSTFAETPIITPTTVPSTVTLSATAAGLTGLGGTYTMVAAAGSESYGPVFSFTIPNLESFFIDGISIAPPIVQGAAVVTAAALEWCVIVNCASGNITTGGGQQIAVPGWHTVAASAAIGTVFSGYILTLPISLTPVLCLPNTNIHICCKQMAGAATTSLKYRGQVYVNGFFQ